jgi:hypothetical protein
VGVRVLSSDGLKVGVLWADVGVFESGMVGRLVGEIVRAQVGAVKVRAVGKCDGDFFAFDVVVASVGL